MHTTMVGGTLAWHPWVVELFSLNRYTDTEIAADAALGAAAREREFLTDKADWELYHRCGGVLVARNWVLTAGHCVNNVLGDGGVLRQRRVRVGTPSLEVGGTTLAIDRAILHPAFQAEPLVNDLALLHLVPDGQTDAAVFADPAKVAPISWAGRMRPLSPGNVVWAMGWGGTGHRLPTRAVPRSSDGPRQKLSPLLRQLQFNVAAPALCMAEGNLYAASVAAGGAICAAPAVSSTGDCNGDSGGPVVTKDFVIPGRATFRLVGLVSQGRGCAAGHPSLFTSVLDHADWIAATIAAPLP